MTHQETHGHPDSEAPAQTASADPGLSPGRPRHNRRNEADWTESERLRRTAVLDGRTVVASARRGRISASWPGPRRGATRCGSIAGTGWSGSAGGEPAPGDRARPQGLLRALRGRYRGESRARAEDCRDAHRQGCSSAGGIRGAATATPWRESRTSSQAHGRARWGDDYEGKG
jgi:hypothetical protein